MHSKDTEEEQLAVRKVRLMIWLRRKTERCRPVVFKMRSEDPSVQLLTRV